MKEETLFKSKWVEVLRRDGWFEFNRNTRGDGVAVLGIRNMKEASPKDSECLIRIENNPAHGGFVYTSLTGTIEGGLNPLQTAVKELKEESGYEVDEQDLVPVGWVYPSKFSDYKQFLYVVELDGKDQGEILGDGTHGEKGASVVWMPVPEAVEVTSPTIGAALIRYILKELF